MAKKQITIQRKSRTVRPKAQAKQTEITAVGRALRAIGGLGGAHLGGLFGAPTIGSSIGTGLGAQLSRWLGQGDYVVNSNTILNQSAGGIPSMHRNNQSIVVRHKEFITEVTGKTAFTVQRQFSINPGLSATFPWLSGVAAQYSEYRIRGMVYHYIPTSGNAVSSTNAALGSVMLQTSYRANESAPTSKVEMMNEYWSNEAKPSESFCHPIECDPRENPFNVQYVRTGGVPSTDNVLLYDLGTTSLAVTGQQADDIVLGDLWVTYEIELSKPKLTDLIGQSLPAFRATATANLNTTTPFGTDVAETFDSMGGGASISSSVFTLSAGNVGYYQMTLYYGGATAWNFDPFTITGTGSSLVNSVYASGASAAPLSATTTGNGVAVVCTFKVTQPNTTTTITPVAATLTNATSLTVVVSKISSDIV